MIGSVAILVGALIIGAAAHVSITATGGYLAPSAPLQIAIALGLIVGAICVPAARRERRTVIALVLVTALLAGESFAVIMTAERVVAARELAQAPLREAHAAKAKALGRVIAAEAALSAVPATSARLEIARTSKSAADAAVIEKSAERGCASNCRALLEAQVDAAQVEVDAARAQIVDRKVAAESKLAAAYAALSEIKEPPSATPLADRLGVAGWALDLITAVLASVAANGLGATLVAFGAHRAVQRAPKGEKAPVVPITAGVLPIQALPAPPLDQVTLFCRDQLSPASADTTTPVAQLFRAQTTWARARALRPLSANEFGAGLAEFVRRAGFEGKVIDGVPHVAGATLRAVELGES